MPRPRSLSPALFWHKHKQQWCVKIENSFHYLGKDESEAQRKRHALIAEWLAGNPKLSPTVPNCPQPPRLVADAVAAYLTHAADRYDYHQLARVRVGLEAVLEVSGTLPAEAFGPKQLKAVRSALLSRPSRRGKLPVEKRPKLSRNYVNSVIGTVQTAWAWLAAEELVPAAQAMALRAVRSLRQGEAGQEVPHVVAVSPGVVEATLPHLGAVVAAMVRVQQLTGCRPSEVCTMRPRDFSRSPEDKLTVPGTKPPMRVGALEVGGVLVWVYVPESHKTLRRGKRRVIVVGPRAQEVLRPFLEGRDPDVYLFSAREASDAWRAAHGRRAVYGRGREPGVRYSSGTYRQSVQDAIERVNRGGAGLPLWSPAMLRKAAATLSDEKADRDTTAALLSHATPDTSAIYSSQAIERAAKHVAIYG